ncbi:MAG: RNA polymerase sigma factor RpoE [Henriciella sp.]
MIAPFYQATPMGPFKEKKKLASVTGLPGRRAEDAELMLRIQTSADKRALAQLALHYAPRLKAWLINRGEQGMTAEDIVQDVMVTVWQKAGMFDPNKASFSTWAYRLTRNKWIDHKRKYDRLQPTEPSVLLSLDDRMVDGADADYDHVEAARAVHDALAKLPNSQKEMLQLSFFEGLSHSQIAKRTGLPLGTVKSQIRGPLKKLQSHLAQYRGAYQ